VAAPAERARAAGADGSAAGSGRVAATALALALLGLAGNYLSWPLFFAVDFLFGGVAVMLAVGLLGPAWGAFVAAVASAYTIWLWGHPYAFFIYVGEAAFVGLMIRRRGWDIVSGVAVYWLLIGIPLGWVFYAGLMDMAPPAWSVIALKQAANAVLAALVAGLLLSHVPLDRGLQGAQGVRPAPLRTLVFHLLLAAVFFPVLISMIHRGQEGMEEMRRDVGLALGHTVRMVQGETARWRHRRLELLRAVAERLPSSGSLAGALASVAPDLKWALGGIRALYLVDAGGGVLETVILDAGPGGAGQAEAVPPGGGVRLALPLGGEGPEARSLAMTAGTATLSAALYGDPGQAEPGGWTDDLATVYLLDADGRLIGRPPGGAGVPAQRQGHRPTALTEEIVHWIPEASDEPKIMRWMRSTFAARAALGSDGWQVLVEVGAAPFVTVLYRSYVKDFVLLLLLTGVAAVLARVLGDWMARPFRRLAELSGQVPERISRAEGLAWPRGRTAETETLTENLREMERLLRRQFAQLQDAKARLEQRVARRTQDLTEANRELQREILERQQAQAALSESEARYRSVVEGARDVIFQTDAAGRFTFLNPAWSEVTGYPQEEGLSMSLFSCMDREAREALTDLLSRPGGGDAAGDRIETRCSRRDGGQAWIEIYPRPIHDEGGRVLGISGIFRDVSERKAAEAALTESEQRYRVLVETATDAILVADAETGRILEGNPRAHDLTGRSGAELKGLHYLKLFPREQRDFYRELFHRHLDSGGMVEDGIVIRHRSGRLVPVDLASGIAEWRGRKVIHGVFRDVTERKHAEDQLRQYGQVFENTMDGVVITDADARILAVNRAFTQVTGYPRDEVVGRSLSLLRSGRHDDAFYAEMWETLERVGRWHGEIWNRRKDGEVYPEWLSISMVRDEQGAAKNFIGVFADISSLKESERRLQYMAHYDSLTDLPNRALLSDRLSHALQRARREDTQVAVLFIDLDRFKNVNDSLGHSAGDDLLRQAAVGLQACVRESDTVARLGGDEFTVVLEALGDPQTAAAVAQKILQRMRSPFRVADQDVFVTASIGISLYPADGADVDALLKNADSAMYQAKERGRDIYQFYTEELTGYARGRLVLETDLRHALARDGLDLFFQPQLEMATGRMVGVEALVRWDHPALGAVSPKEFIPLAEETGVIETLGEWVLQRACRQAAAWQRAGLPAVRVAVNLSRYQLVRGGIVETVARALEASGLEPRWLELEVTEGFFMREMDEAASAVGSLKALGASVAIDDFGTGYSSLAALKGLAVDNLKIDQSFIRDIPGDANDAAIARAVIALGRSLQLTVTAEGVETDAQHAFLRRHGCDLVQGFLYSRPVPAPRITELLSAGPDLRAGG
jgi:diguanylate cyclase (GGDEF)-like protein/PAS domain S-box-containing protein